MQSYSKNLTTILTIFSINLYTLESKSMRQSNMNETAINSHKTNNYESILSDLCIANLLYNTGHSLQQLETIAKIKSQQTSTIMRGKIV